MLTSTAPDSPELFAPRVSATSEEQENKKNRDESGIYISLFLSLFHICSLNFMYLALEIIELYLSAHLYLIYMQNEIMPHVKKIKKCKMLTFLDVTSN